MDNKRLITIAIDGFSSSGKSTMAKKLAKTIGYAYIDTGAMYRAVTLYCLRNGLFDGDSLDTERLEAALPDINITFGVDADGKTQTMLNGEVVEQEIRRMEVSSKVSIVAAVGSVRRALVKQQQAMGKQKGIVMDGRDIGTVVFPDAEMKVYVDGVDTGKHLSDFVADGSGNLAAIASGKLAKNDEAKTFTIKIEFENLANNVNNNAKDKVVEFDMVVTAVQRTAE